MSEVRIAVNDRPMFLGSRGRANRLRHGAEAALLSSAGTVVVFDFSNVEGVIENALGVMELVASMHGPVLQKFREATVL